MSYSKMTITQAEEIIGIRLEEIRTVPINMLVSERLNVDKETMEALKEGVYTHILQYLNFEGYPTEANQYFKEQNVSDLVLYTIGPILDAVRNMGRKIRLTREKEIVSVDGETGGSEEFVVMDWIAIGADKYMMIIETKKTSTGQAMKQIVLSMKDARDNNAGGVVYGFVTTGAQWQMIMYDGSEFLMTEELTLLFRTMKENKEKWMAEYSAVVDCLVVALCNGGMAEDMVVQG